MGELKYSNKFCNRYKTGSQIVTRQGEMGPGPFLYDARIFGVTQYIYAATLTYSTALPGFGMGWPSSFIPSR